MIVGNGRTDRNSSPLVTVAPSIGLNSVARTSPITWKQNIGRAKGHALSRSCDAAFTALDQVGPYKKETAARPPRTSPRQPFGGKSSGRGSTMPAIALRLTESFDRASRLPISFDLIHSKLINTRPPLPP